jgi:hypothetical protein
MLFSEIGASGITLTLVSVEAPFAPAAKTFTIARRALFSQFFWLHHRSRHVSSRLHPFRRQILAAVLLTLCVDSTAHARRGLLLITTGDTVKHIGEVTSDMQASVREATGQLDDLKVGYLHDRFGVFWVDVWTWGGHYVLYNDSDDVWELEDEQAANLMGMSTSQLSKPIFYTIPPGLAALGILSAVWGYTASRQQKRERARRAELEEAARDPRYQRALTSLNEFNKQREQVAASGEAELDAEKLAASNQAAYDRAVHTLVEQGIPREEADSKLWMLLNAAQAS